MTYAKQVTNCEIIIRNDLDNYGTMALIQIFEPFREENGKENKDSMLFSCYRPSFVCNNTLYTTYKLTLPLYYKP